MAKKDAYEARAEELLTPIAAANGCEVYDVEYVKEGSDWYLRAYIDKPEGVSIIDCENVSRAFSDKLDEEDFISDAYILEVSSRTWQGIEEGPPSGEEPWRRSRGQNL